MPLRRGLGPRSATATVIKPPGRPDRPRSDASSMNKPSGRHDRPKTYALSKPVTQRRDNVSLRRNSSPKVSGSPGKSVSRLTTPQRADTPTKLSSSSGVGKATRLAAPPRVAGLTRHHTSLALNTPPRAGPPSSRTERSRRSDAPREPPSRLKSSRKKEESKPEGSRANKSTVLGDKTSKMRKFVESVTQSSLSRLVRRGSVKTRSNLIDRSSSEVKSPEGSTVSSNHSAGRASASSGRNLDRNSSSVESCQTHHEGKGSTSSNLRSVPDRSATTSKHTDKIAATRRSSLIPRLTEDASGRSRTPPVGHHPSQVSAAGDNARSAGSRSVRNLPKTTVNRGDSRSRPVRTDGSSSGRPTHSGNSRRGVHCPCVVWTLAWCVLQYCTAAQTGSPALLYIFAMPIYYVATDLLDFRRLIVILCMLARHFCVLPPFPQLS